MSQGVQILGPNGLPLRSSVPNTVLQKGWKKLPQTPASSGPKTEMYDPMSLMYSLGYKDRRFSLTYDVIRQVVRQLSLTSAIVKHRIGQVLQFCSPYRISKQGSGLGFEVKHKADDRAMSSAEIRFARELENFILFCGNPKPNKYTGKRRPDFEEFTKMFLRDLLELDQGCAEIVPTKSKLPYEFIAVDGATIRLAADEYNTLGKRNDQRYRESLRAMYNPLGRQVQWPQLTNRSVSIPERISHVQVVRGEIKTLYKEGEMAFCIMNPRTDLMSNGYGESNVELLIRVITAHLYAEQHNMNVFKQGALPKSMFNIVGENPDQTMLENFRRQWQAQVTGTENTWKVPVLSGPEVQHIPLQGTNLEMEYNNWVNYLVRTQCAVWGIDSSEVGYDLQMSTGQFTPPQYESPQEWKIKKSKDRGLRPILRAYAHFINKHIIDRIDDHFYLDFVGLDELDQKDKMEMLQQEATVYRTIDEVREMNGLEPLPDDEGAIIMNPTFLQARQMQQNQEMMEQQQEQEAAQAQDKQLQPQIEAETPVEDGQQQAAPPQVGKSLNWQEALQDSELVARIDHVRGYAEVGYD